MLFDTHAHYDDARFDPCREALLRELPRRGVALVVNCGSDLESSARSLELTAAYPYFYAAVGIHPHECGEAPADWEPRLLALAAHSKAVAIGEIGLDYHYDFSPRETQRLFFRRQCELANRLGLPVIVHDREAHADTFDILSELRPRGVLHCYSGSAEQAQQYARMGFYFGFGGAVTFKNARRALESAAVIPPDRLLLETDCPYMAPEPVRGTRCDSSLIRYVGEYVASVKGISPEEVFRQTAQNAKAVYQL